MSEDIAVLTQVRDNLNKEIEQLTIKLSNIHTALREEEIRKESDRKLAELKEKTKAYVDDKTINKKLSVLVDKEHNLEQREQRFSDRELALHKREQELVDLEDRRKKLNEDRNTFNNYKINVLKELDEAKQTIEQAKVEKDEIQSREDNLRAREKALSKKFEEFDRAMGIFIKEKRDYEIAKNSELMPV
jgi:hypothetical protein